MPVSYTHLLAEHDAKGETFIVIPRVGTISSWSSKATDIAHNCGLNEVELSLIHISQEKSAQKQQSILDNVPNAFPALLRAQKMQKQCSKIGFDWNELEPVLAKVEEELQEVRDEVNQMPRNQEKIEEEIGDLFFAMVNLSRHLKCNAEEALRKANNKFEQRFRKVEEKALERGSSVKDLSLIEMDILWDEVKREEK